MFIIAVIETTLNIKGYNMNDLQQLETLCTDILTTGSFFQLDDGEQSFITAPTNHVYLINDFYSINVGHVVYGNVMVYEEILDDLQSIYDCCKAASEELSDYVSVVYIREGQEQLRAVMGGLNDDNDQVMEDFDNVPDLLHFLKTFEFNS